MEVSGTPPDPRFDAILQKYSEGGISAYNAACEIQDLGIPGFDDPSASDVIMWAKMAGYGIPSPSRAQAQEEADAILRKHAGPESPGQRRLPP